jgi:hypothetical protein
MRVQATILSVFILQVVSQLQQPLSFESARQTQQRISQASLPSFGAPFLGDAFIKFAASHVDASAINSFRTAGSFDALSEDDFTALTHPAYPKHSVRVKKSRFCNSTVDAYTGYVDVEARHIFFEFFKSRGDWRNDPVMVCVVLTQQVSRTKFPDRCGRTGDPDLHPR